VPKKGFPVGGFEIKTNRVDSRFWRMGLVLTGEPVTEPFEFSLHEFVSRFTVNQLQWCASAEGVFWFVKPGIGFRFVAKDLLGLAFDQLNMIHFWLSGESLASAPFQLAADVE
jgi:hypothetical protein